MAEEKPEEYVCTWCGLPATKAAPIAWHEDRADCIAAVLRRILEPNPEEYVDYLLNRMQEAESKAVDYRVRLRLAKIDD